jgi:hypothetical protein
MASKYRHFVSQPLTSLEAELDLAGAQHWTFTDQGRQVHAVELDGMRVYYNDAGLILTIAEVR